VADLVLVRPRQNMPLEWDHAEVVDEYDEQVRVRWAITTGASRGARVVSRLCTDGTPRRERGSLDAPSQWAGVVRKSRLDHLLPRGPAAPFIFSVPHPSRSTTMARGIRQHFYRLHSRAKYLAGTGSVALSCALARFQNRLVETPSLRRFTYLIVTQPNQAMQPTAGRCIKKVED